MGYRVAGCLALVCALSALFPSQAEARKRGLLFITYGEDIKTVKDLPDGPRQATGMPDLVLGYKYSGFGLFWMNLWTWGGEFVLYSPAKEAYDDLPSQNPAEIAQALGLEERDVKKPFLYSFPLLLLIVVGIGAVLLVGKVLGSRGSAEMDFTGEPPSSESPPASPGAPPAT